MRPGLSATALLEIILLSGQDFRITPDVPSKPCSEYCQLLKFNNDINSTDLLEREDNQSITIITKVSANATTFEWQKSTSDKKLLRIVSDLHARQHDVRCSTRETRSVHSATLNLLTLVLSMFLINVPPRNAGIPSHLLNFL